MACLDTSFIIDLLQGKDGLEPLLKELERETALFIPAPAFMELWLGALLSRNSEQEKEKIKLTLSSFPILPLDQESAREAAEIEAELIKKGQIIETEDIMIAAIARKNNQKIITRDNHYMRISGLKVFKY